MNNKPFWKSKRFWAGLVTLITAVGFIFTGEKPVNEAVSEIVLAALGLVQTTIGLISTDKVTAK